jgi:hypothetical protein
VLFAVPLLEDIDEEVEVVILLKKKVRVELL